MVLVALALPTAVLLFLSAAFHWDGRLGGASASRIGFNTLTITEHVNIFNNYFKYFSYICNYVFACITLDTPTTCKTNTPPPHTHTY
jgi:hypothetical protein